MDASLVQKTMSCYHILVLGFLTISVDVNGECINLLQCVICHLKFSYFQISNSKLKSSCILVVHMLAWLI
jgi:hypothetical protein